MPPQCHGALWKVLWENGVGGPLLRPLKSLYNSHSQCTLDSGMAALGQQISTVPAVMRSLYRSVMVKKELSQKAKLSIDTSFYVPTLTSLRGRVRRTVTREVFGVEPLPLIIKRSQLRWLEKTQDTLE